MPGHGAKTTHPKLALPADDMEAIRLFTQDHIIQVRRSPKTGRLLEVDHVEFGWMKPEMYYRLQKLDDAMPLLEKVLEGGYRAKAALWSTTASVHVLGTGVALPVGIGVILGGLAAYAFHNAVGKTAEAILDLLSIFLPFGEVWLFYSGAVAFAELELPAPPGPPEEEQEKRDRCAEIQAAYFAAVERGDTTEAKRLLKKSFEMRCFWTVG